MESDAAVKMQQNLRALAAARGAGLGWLVASVTNARAARIAITGEIDGAPIGQRLGEWRAPMKREAIVRRVRLSRYGFLTRSGEPPMKRVLVSRPLFPGYVFVRPDQGVTYHDIARADGVERLVGKAIDGGPALISDEQYDAIVARLVGVEAENAAMTPRLRVAMLVQVLSGPFATYNGVVDQVLAKERVKVGVAIFGRRTLVELSDDQVEYLGLDEPPVQPAA